jgi:hypothetical protein
MHLPNNASPIIALSYNPVGKGAQLVASGGKDQHPWKVPIDLRSISGGPLQERQDPPIQ